MEIIFEILFQFVAEIFLQLFAEALFELGFHSLAEAFNRKRRRNPILAAIGYLLWGAIIGAVTLFVFPSLMIKNPILRVVNLIITPVIAGLFMSLVGSWRSKKDQDLLRIDSFIYGALFAFGLAMVRFFYGNHIFANQRVYLGGAWARPCNYAFPYFSGLSSNSSTIVVRAGAIYGTPFTFTYLKNIYHYYITGSGIVE